MVKKIIYNFLPEYDKILTRQYLPMTELDETDTASEKIG